MFDFFKSKKTKLKELRDKNVNVFRSFKDDINLTLSLTEDKKLEEALNKMYKFAKINFENNEIDYKYIENSLKGKKAESKIKNKFNKYFEQNKNIKIFNDFNIKQGNKSVQIDCFIISNNNVYIIDVKDWSKCIGVNVFSDKVWPNYYKTTVKPTLYNDFDNKRLFIEEIINKFETQKNVKYNIYNIVAFFNPSKYTIKDTKNITEYEYNLNILFNNKYIQLIFGEDNIDKYFSKYLSYVNNDYIQIADELSKFLKSDVDTTESSDKNYVIRLVQKFFKDVDALLETYDKELKL